MNTLPFLSFSFMPLCHLSLRLIWLLIQNMMSICRSTSVSTETILSTCKLISGSTWDNCVYHEQLSTCKSTLNYSMSEITFGTKQSRVLQQCLCETQLSIIRLLSCDTIDNSVYWRRVVVRVRHQEGQCVLLHRGIYETTMFMWDITVYHQATNMCYHRQQCLLETCSGERETPRRTVCLFISERVVP